MATEILEGKQSIVAALAAAQRRFQVILIRRDSAGEKLEELLELAVKRGVSIRHVDRSELDALAHGATHGGVLALCSPKPRWGEAELVDHVSRLRNPALLLLLEGVDDARNLGFSLRSAEALGAHAVLIKKHLWDFDPTEVARPASGAYERLPLVQFESLDLLKELRRIGLQLVGCLARAKRSMHQIDMRVPTILAVGGEKRGLSGAVRGLCDAFATIPTKDGASLSLSHASAILLAEAMRQRIRPSDEGSDSQ